MNPELLVEAIRAIEAAQERYPTLGYEGFYPIKTRDGLRHRPQPNPHAFPEQVATSLAFFRFCMTAKSTYNVRAYSLKHFAEKWGAANEMERYVPTGAVIVAALYLGFPIKTEKAETLPGYHRSLPLNDIVWVLVNGCDRAIREKR